MKAIKLGTVLVGISLAACAAPSDDVTSDQSELARATTTTTAKGLITDRVTFNPIQGASVCVVGNSALPCATSDANGGYSLQVPANMNVAVLIKEQNHIDNYLTFTTTDAAFDLGPLRVMDKQFDATFAQQAGGQRDTTTGELVVAVFDQFPNPGTVIEHVSLEVSGGGGHMFYTDGQGVPSTTQTETSTRGTAGVVNMHPGTYTMWLTHPSMNCKNAVAWNTPSGDGMKMQIFPGATTVVYAVCR
jgi:hypothetical protein